MSHKLIARKKTKLQENHVMRGMPKKRLHRNSCSYWLLYLTSDLKSGGLSMD